MFTFLLLSSCETRSYVFEKKLRKNTITYFNNHPLLNFFFDNPTVVDRNGYLVEDSFENFYIL